MKNGFAFKEQSSYNLMKNQYFGDINDYKKYGLIRQLSNFGELKTVICWMLTPNDHKKKEGSQTQYLENPDKWEQYDDALFKHLQKHKSHILGNQNRNISLITKGNVLPKCKFFNDTIPDNGELRSQYFQKLLNRSNDADLIFFDPDIGMANSVEYDSKRSSQYLYWCEVKDAHDKGHSILLYQHRHRNKTTEKMIEHLRTLALSLFNASNIFIYSTPNVLFLLIAKNKHLRSFVQANKRIEQSWGNALTIHGR